MDLDTICSLLIDALRDAQYNPNTVFLYQGEVRRFKEFCRGKGITDYTSATGKVYADDVISPKTGKYSDYSGAAERPVRCSLSTLSGGR